jgi:hypothetical protein
MKLSRPEIEAKSTHALERIYYSRELQSLVTCVDLLEICEHEPRPRIVWDQNLDHASLIQHIEVSPLAVRNSLVC